MYVYNDIQNMNTNINTNMFFFFFLRHSYLEHGMDPNEENETSGIQDVCSVTLDKAPCGVRLC